MAILKHLARKAQHKCKVPSDLKVLNVSMNSNGVVNITFYRSDGTCVTQAVTSNHRGTCFNVENIARIEFSTDNDMVEFMYDFGTVLASGYVTL